MGVQTVQKTVEVPQLQFIDKVVDIPVEAQRQIPMVQTVQKTIEIPQLQYIDKVVDVPVVQVVQVPQVQVVEKTVEIPQSSQLRQCRSPRRQSPPPQCCRQLMGRFPPRTGRSLAYEMTQFVLLLNGIWFNNQRSK